MSSGNSEQSSWTGTEAHRSVSGLAQEQMWISEAGTVAQRDLEPWGSALCPRHRAMPVPRQMNPSKNSIALLHHSWGSLPALHGLCWCLMQILLFRFQILSYSVLWSPSMFLNPCSTLELSGGALENKNFNAWAHPWKTDFFGLGWSPGISILPWALRDEKP